MILIQCACATGQLLSDQNERLILSSLVLQGAATAYTEENIFLLRLGYRIWTIPLTGISLHYFPDNLYPKL